MDESDVFALIGPKLRCALARTGRSRIYATASCTEMRVPQDEEQMEYALTKGTAVPGSS